MSRTTSKTVRIRLGRRLGWRVTIPRDLYDAAAADTPIGKTVNERIEEIALDGINARLRAAGKPVIA